MLRIIRESADFFRREKLYAYLAVALVCLYAFVFAGKRWLDLPPKTERSSVKQIELRTAVPEATAADLERELAGRPRFRRALKLFTFFFLLAMIWGMMLSALAVQRFLFGKQEFVPHAHHRHSHISWGIREVIKLLILFAWVGIGANVVLKLFVFHGSQESYLQVLLHTFVVDLLVLFVVLRLARKSGTKELDFVGAGRGIRPAAELGYGLYAYLLVLPLLFGLLILLSFLAKQFTYEPPPHPLVDVFLEKQGVSPAVLWFSLVLACLVGPAIEEMFFRGFLYPALKKYVGMGWAMALSSALFAAVHENIFSFVPIFLLGFVLCYLYEKRKTVLPCVSLHVVHNSLFIIYFFLMKNILFQLGG